MSNAETGRRTWVAALVTLAWQVALLLAAVAIWEWCARAGIGRQVVVRSPSEVWDALVELSRDGVISTNLWSTLEAAMLALLLSTVIGVPIGLALALLPRTEAVVSPFIDALNASPRIALAPIFVIIFGLSQSSKVALAFSMVVFIILVNSRAGVRSADQDVVALMDSLGASKRQLFFKVLLPTAIPSIFAALRLGLIYALLGVVAQELIAAREGMGTLIAQYSARLQTDKVYALILVLVVVASALNAVSARAERWLLRWQRDPA